MATASSPPNPRRGRRWRRAFAVALLLPASVLRDGIIVPDRWKPWTPIAIAEAPGPFISLKLRRLDHAADACLAVLAGSSFEFEPVLDKVTAPGCGFRNAVRIARTSAALSAPVTLSCRTAVALALWEHHVAQPAAISHLGVPIAAVDHYGTYACRNVNHRSGGQRSRHATADAIDIAGFVLADGRRIRIRSQWKDPDPAGDFLKEIHRGACPLFDAALGPNYNDAHRDHFHFDRGGFRICR